MLTQTTISIVIIHIIHCNTISVSWNINDIRVYERNINELTGKIYTRIPLKHTEKDNNCGDRLST